jgi:hypothetical protein
MGAHLDALGKQLSVEGLDKMSPKQAIYRWFIHHGFIELRMRGAHAASGSWWWLFRHRRRFCGYGVALANLLHRLHETILLPEFTETDFGFLNQAVPRFLHEVGEEADTGLVAMLVQLHDAVPAELQSELTWHPNDFHRRRVEMISETLSSFEDLVGRSKLPE